MTVESSELNKKTFPGNGSATEFSVSEAEMPIFSKDDFTVIFADSDGNETTVSEGTGSSNYKTTTTFPGTRQVGFSVTYPADEVTPMTANEKIVVKRQFSFEQNLDIENQGGYAPEALEKTLDRITVLCRQLKEELDRAVKVTISSSTDPEDLVANLLQAATDAETAQTAAETAQTASEAALESFQARYLDPAASDPTVDGNGDAVTTGDLYFNTTSNVIKVYNGSSWAPVNFGNDSVDTAQLVDGAVTLAKEAGGTALAMKGFDASGDPEEYTAGDGISRAAGTISLDYASEAEAEAGLATDKPLNSLRVSQAIAAFATQKVQASVNFNGTGTIAIRDSYNVSSITDDGTGLTTINLSITMSNADYAVGGSAKLDDDTGANTRVMSPTSNTTTTSCQITTESGGNTRQDCELVSAIIVGDQA